MSEHDIQVALFDWARLKRNQDYRYGLLVAIPNQGGSGKSAIIRGRKMQREGMAKGFPDMMLLHPCGPYCGLFIELKASKKSQTSPEQRWWLQALSDEGYCTSKAVGFDQAVSVIETYLGLEE